MLKGVDLSHWQSNFDAFKSVDFAIIKATEGVGYTDPAFYNLYDKAKKSGKLLGVNPFDQPGVEVYKEEVYRTRLHLFRKGNAFNYACRYYH